MNSVGGVPFNRPTTTGKEFTWLERAIAKGHISGNGSISHLAEDLLRLISGSPHVLLTTNCTHALELSARILGLSPGDEVIVPSYTFVSTASAFALSGARPVFVDVDDLTLNLDVDQVSSAISSRTKAICTVHYAGIGHRIDDLARLANQNGIALVEDNAHGLGATYNERKLGSFGALATLSFHETKNITCGEGGALCVNDSDMLPVAEILREKGTDRAQFFRGQVDKYTWREVGSSWVLSDLLAAFLMAQLEEFEEIQSKRLQIWDTYDQHLTGWASQNGVRTPYVPKESKHPAHMYFLRMPDLASRSRFIEHMREKDLMAVFHYQALNESKVGIELGGKVGASPIAATAADTLVRIPLFTNMNQSEIDRVVDAVQRFEV